MSAERRGILSTYTNRSSERWQHVHAGKSSVYVNSKRRNTTFCPMGGGNFEHHTIYHFVIYHLVIYLVIYHLVIFAFSHFRAQRYCFFWTCANKKQKISAKKFRHALKREHFEMLKGTIPKIQIRSCNLWFISRIRSNYASLLAPKCQKNHAKCIFFEFSCQKIWSCKKKAVPLHPLSFKEHQIAPSGGSQFPRLTGTLPGAIV